MSEPTDSAHPEELLAGFVDGSLAAGDRARVERHVAGCARCAAEISLAGEARSALRALPQLDAPGLTVEDLHVVTPITKAPRLTRAHRIAWGAGIAAAAALVVVFAVSSLHPSPTRSGTAVGPVAGKATGPGGALLVVNHGTNYDQQSISSLASQLVSGQGRLAAPQAPEFGTADQAAPSAMVPCLQQGAGLDASASPTYLEIATYQGAPVFVGAFVTQPPAGSGSTSHLLVVVVTQQGCQPVTVVRQPL